MTRAEHIDWCKQRALEYIERGDCRQAFTSMASDLSKHDETRDHPAIKLGVQLLMLGELATAAAMREFILGFQ